MLFENKVLFLSFFFMEYSPADVALIVEGG